jgi:hypothetical protein
MGTTFVLLFLLLAFVDGGGTFNLTLIHTGWFSSKYTILVLHSSGVIRGNYLPSRFGTPCPVPVNESENTLCSGGLWHQAARIEAIRERPSHPNSLLLTTGNWMQGNVIGFCPFGAVCATFLGLYLFCKFLFALTGILY